MRHGIFSEVHGMDDSVEPTFEDRLTACIIEAKISSGVSDGVASALQGISQELLAKPMAANVIRKHASGLIEGATERNVVPPS